MGLTGHLLRYAAQRPHVLVVATPGSTATRLTVEALTRRDGWPRALSPADADLLVVCGEPREPLARAVGNVWDEMPSPRAMVTLPSPVPEAEVAIELEHARERLADTTAQQADANTRRAAGPWQPTDKSGPTDHTATDTIGPDGHGGHGGHGGHMGAPVGVAMADRGVDRDGLRLDLLHVPLGPVLPYWPDGLVVDTVLQGDVVQEAVVGAVPGGLSFWDEPWSSALSGESVRRGLAERRRAAAHLDSLERLLAVVGWADAARQAAVLRDAALGDAGPDELTRRFARFARRVRRSRSLRWALRGVGVIERPEAYGLAGPAARHPGDALARMGGWLTESGEALARAGDSSRLDGTEGPRGPVGDPPSAALLRLLPQLLVGTELAEARLVVASLDPDLARLTPESAHV